MKCIPFKFKNEKYKIFVLFFLLIFLIKPYQAAKKEKKIYKISKSHLKNFKQTLKHYNTNRTNLGVYYDDTHDNVEDLVSYSVDVTNRVLKSSSFQFEYSINRVDHFNSYKLTKTCTPFFFKYSKKIKK